MAENITHDVGIVGGGISGLITARELAKIGKKVVLLETTGSLGGLAGSFEKNGYRVDKFYHHFFQQDEEVMLLLEELGLTEEIIESRTRSGFYFDGSWYDVSSPLNLLSFKPLSFFERISFGQTLLKARSERYPLRLDDVSVKDWLNLKEGTGMYTIFDRMLQGKFGIGVNEVSAAFLSDRFRARAQKRSVSSKEEKFSYLKSSLGLLMDVIEKDLLSRGVTIRKNCKVSSLNSLDAHFQASCESGETIVAKKVVSSINPAVFAGLADFINEEEKRRLMQIRYGAVVCSVLALDREISPYYWGTICDPSVPFQLLADQTKLVGVEEFNGDYIYYASRYCSQEELRELDIDKHEADIRSHLNKISFSGKDPEVLWQQTFTDADATPIFCKGYQSIIKSFPEMDGVWMTGMPFIYPFARNMNSMIRIAKRTSAEVARDFKGEKVSSYCSLID